MVTDFFSMALTSLYGHHYNVLGNVPIFLWRISGALGIHVVVVVWFKLVISSMDHFRGVPGTKMGPTLNMSQCTFQYMYHIKTQIYR